MSEEPKPELIPSEPRTPARVDELPATATMPQIIIATLLDSRVDADKLDRIVAVQERIEAREHRRLYYEAMARFQGRIKIVPKRRKIMVKNQLRSKYAALEDYDAELRGPLAAEGFSIQYGAEIESESKITVVITIRHEAGHEEMSRVTLPLDKSEYRNVVQNYGATLSYCRRYALALALNIVTKDEDDDANSLSQLTEQERNSIEDILAEIGGTARESLLAFVGSKSVSEISRGAYTASMSWCLAKRRQAQRQA